MLLTALLFYPVLIYLLDLPWVFYLWMFAPTYLYLLIYAPKSLFWNRVTGLLSTRKESK